jgi:elongation factor G
MYIPEPIISLAILPKDKKSYDNMGKALNRFCKEDPTFKSYFDEESNETIISGMGELHLDVYIERMKREYKCELEVGQPQVAYRESFSQEVAFDYTHKKQSGGRGQYARVAGFFRPLDDEDSRFVDKIVGGVIPANFISPCEKGFLASLSKGALAGFPVVQVEMELTDGAFHAVDSSQLTFEIATKAAFREYYHKAKPYLMEPIMKIEIETPNEYRGNVMGSINQRRGIIIDNDIDEQFTRITADVPLSEIFGYITQLRSLTQGKAELSVQFHAYKKMPKSIEEKVLDDLRRKEKK